MDRIHEDHNPTVTVIQPQRGWIPVNLKEIWLYRELLYFLTKRDIKVRYKQTLLGGLWAIIQPFCAMVVFSIFFGRLVKVPSDGIPYPIFVYAGLLPWTYFANAVTASGNSLVGSAHLVTKIYFPRTIIPVSAATAGLVDFFIAFAVMVGLMLYYQFWPGGWVLLFPVLVGLTFVCAAGCGLWLSALNVQYRDIRYMIPFLIQIWLFISPVIYPASLLGDRYRWLLALNPMAGIIHAYRACLLGRHPVDWGFLGISTLVTVGIFISGLFYFRRVEKSFADVI